MKKSMVLRFIILICCINLYLVASYAQTLSDELVFEERVFDFGEIKEENGLVSHEFEFKNVSQKVISINGVTSGCGCVQFEFPKEPLRPNATGKVKVTYNPAYRPGFFSKEVVVLSNNNANYNRIWVKGTVIPCKHPVSENYPYEYGSGLWMNFEVMAFGTIGKGGTKTMKLKYVNDTDNDIQLMFVVIGGNTDLKFTSPRQVKAREEGVMPVEYQYSGSFPTDTRVYPVINGRALMKPLKITCTNPVD
ncbi:DUF1573 domain-containing protein [Bacteroides thetaiotaomicron]|jgi:hypothetical protein|uniref:DUF1573 domain-containing protein n=2 Tax=Bacteroides thetaiotaomicron TaxID=818 RepID=UPI001CE3604C|nr:DUF1573 domain-containing protein [Bacteroides thetaiotaomicron]